MVLFAAEAGFTLHPKLGRVWAKRGSQPVVWTRSQPRPRLNLFGWVNPLRGARGAGRRGLRQAERGNPVAFLAFLAPILVAYPSQLIHLWVAHAAWHKGDVVGSFLQRHTRLKLWYQPPYHPELNCQEPVWKRIRYEVTTDRYAPRMADLEQSIFATVAAWPDAKVKSFCVAKCKLY